METLARSLTGFPDYLGVQREYLWSIFLPGMETMPIPLLGAIQSNLVNRYCQSVRFGNYDISELFKLITGAKTKSFGSKLSIDQVSMTFIVPVPDVTTSYFLAWRRLVVSEEGYYNPSSYYKRRVSIVMEDRTGVGTNFISLIGCFPVKMPVYEPAYGKEDVLRCNISLSIDDIKQGLGGIKNVVANIGRIASSLF